MLMTRSVVALGLASMVLGPTAVSAQDYPNKPVRIVTASVGGATDALTRLLAERLAGPLNQRLVVDNRGGSAQARADMLMRAPADGYTLYVNGAAHWLLPFMRPVSYDPIKDFSPITILATQPNVLVVNPSLPVKSVKDLITLAKAKPGVLNYATAGIGGATYLSAELFKSMTGLNIVLVTYKGPALVVTGLMGGETQLTFLTLLQAEPHIKSEKLRALGITSSAPASAFPTVPTIAASVPGYEYGAKTALFAPPKTPAAIIDRLNRETVRVLNSADVKNTLARGGAETVGSSRQETIATIQSEMTRLGKIIKDAGIDGSAE